jgi:PAS domain S-box-containing protein
LGSQQAHDDPWAWTDLGPELRSVAQLKMLRSLAAKLNRLNDVREIGDTITAELGSLIDYHNCRVFLLQPDGETLLPIAFRGTLSEYQGETFDALIIKVGQGLTGYVAQTGRSYYAPDANQDPHAMLIPGTPELDESILAVPMIYGDEVIGVIVLSKLGIDQFDEEDVRVLEVLASHAAIAVENARLLKLEFESAERARESEARKSAIVESALDCIVVMDEHGIVVEFNPEAERTFGYSREQAIGKEMALLIIPPAFRDAHRSGLARYRATGEGPMLGKRIEITAMRADGSEFPVELAITRVDVPGPALFTGCLRDITERKRAEAERDRVLEAERGAAVRLRELDEMKNTFLQAVSHDLRTPLAAVLGLALTLDREELALSPEDKRDLTKRLAANARKLDRILANLLDLERLIRGVVEPRREHLDVGALVRRVIAEADFLARRDVSVEITPAWAMVDGAKVERIVENLLVNATRHTPEACPIWVRVEGRDSTVLITVEDAGPGVPAELREAIFLPFQQGHQTHSSPGTGIGLALVDRFTQLHGGRAWVEEREGGGACFRVSIPTAQPEQAVALFGG